MRGPPPLPGLSDGLAAKIAALSPEKRTLLELRLQQGLQVGHQLVARSLRSLGVTHVYGLSGTPTIQTLAACAENGIRPIGVHHQQAAVLMAAAQNYAAGRIRAVAILSAGPAVTNAATGILVARDNCWPLIVLGGRRSLNGECSGSFQELDAVPLFKPITKWAAVVESSDQIADHIGRAFRLATRGQPGPVYLDLPEDVLTNCAPGSLLPEPKPAPLLACEPADAAQAAELLLCAERPGMILGKGLRWSEPYRELRLLADRYSLPFITSPMGKGYLPDRHPLCFNAVHSQFQAGVDTILLLGARLDWTFRYGSELAPDAKLIHVDVQHEELGKNVAPALGIRADVKSFLQQLIGQLDQKTAGRGRDKSHYPWLDALAEKRRRKTSKLESLGEESGLPMSPHRMVREIREALPSDAICVVDGNVSMAAAQGLLPSHRAASRFTAGSNGCMGVGIPFGMGAKLDSPDRLVVVISGDTAFGFNGMELETAVRHGIPIIVIVANNEGLSGALTQKTFYPQDYPERITMLQPDIRYEQIIGAFGGHAEYVEHPDELKPALDRAIASGLPACINVRVDPHAPNSGDIR